VFDEVYILFHFNIILKHNGMSSTKINNEGFFISNCIILLFVIFTILFSLAFPYSYGTFWLFITLFYSGGSIFDLRTWRNLSQSHLNYCTLIMFDIYQYKLPQWPSYLFIQIHNIIWRCMLRQSYPPKSDHCSMWWRWFIR